jgi:hypothetical protein
VIFCDAKIGVDFLDPIIIVDALVNHGVFRLQYSEDGWWNVLLFSSFKP